MSAIHRQNCRFRVYITGIPLHTKIYSTVTVLCIPCQKDGVNVKLDVNKMYPDSAIQRELRNHIVTCPNKDCGWTGSFIDYHQEHVMGCLSAYILCEHNGCGKQVRRDDATAHHFQCDMKLVNCRKCGQICIQREMKCDGDQCGRSNGRNVTRETTTIYVNDETCISHRLLSQKVVRFPPSTVGLLVIIAFLIIYSLMI